MSHAPATASPLPVQPDTPASPRAVAIAAAAAAVSMAMVFAPAPEGLPEAGKRVIAVAVLVIALWCTEVVPAALTSLILVVALVLTGAVPGFAQALVGFADPVAYFLIGVLTIGLAVSHSGLAERVAHFFLHRSRG
ncbi:MAG: anion permease, partial [Rhodocyclaceae bacterium]|nr:anion permease [Rhodocyclaceae bacterium]